MTQLRPSFPLIAAWLGLLGVLALTVTMAYVPLGAANALVALGIGIIKAGLVVGIFMGLRHRSGLTRLFAGAGLVWLGILLWLGLMDFLTRT
ncbi:cytochrome C oxidase subunit IV family protein [Bradyrhizobium sp. Pear77]|uniref:cytochrome C oxidase subunit IV family protein n=1 Tax=Bradyrhizobium altum TaxID=1571202 RepID=UPI001E40464C|nr:cytochrome C oxidase subunit IV family protein [Bradyrhizobium altum]MCC8957235.1 cytochrome C oxidase subunit IV family protein [Bradyrhizobium altum]